MIIKYSNFILEKTNLSEINVPNLFIKFLYNYYDIKDITDYRKIKWSLNIHNHLYSDLKLANNIAFVKNGNDIKLLINVENINIADGNFFKDLNI